MSSLTFLEFLLSIQTSAQTAYWWSLLWHFQAGGSYRAVRTTMAGMAKEEPWTAGHCSEHFTHIRSRSPHTNLQKGFHPCNFYRWGNPSTEKLSNLIRQRASKWKNYDSDLGSLAQGSKCLALYHGISLDFLCIKWEQQYVPMVLLSKWDNLCKSPTIVYQCIKNLCPVYSSTEYHYCYQVQLFLVKPPSPTTLCIPWGWALY